MKSKTMYASLGSDGRLWSFSDTLDEAEEIRSQQTDPTWYKTVEVSTADYFDLATGRLKTQKFKG